MEESPVETLANLHRSLQTEIHSLEAEKLGIFKRIQVISQELEQMESRLAVVAVKKEGLDEVVTETSKGYRRVEVTMHALVSLVQKQLKVIRRLAAKARKD